MLTSREAASLTILTFIAVLTVATSKDRRRLRTSWANVVRAALHPRIIQVLLIYNLAIAASTSIAARIDLWDTSLLKDTLILAAFSGIPQFISKPLAADNGRQLLADTTKATIGVAALATTYVNLTPFPYVAELFLQVLIIFLAISAEFSKRDHPHSTTATSLQRIQGYIGLLLLLWVTYRLAKDFETYDWTQQLKSVAFSIYLPLSMVPFAYVLGVLAGVESTLAHIKVRNRQIKRSVKIATIIGFRARLVYVRAFQGDWLISAAKSKTYKDARNVMARYRRTVRANIQVNRERERRLRRLAGKQGRGDDGRWLDRREFHETKQALHRLYCSEAGLYRNRGQHYHDDKTLTLLPTGPKGLPNPTGIQLRVRGDGQAWYAWRKTVGGCYLAVGGSSDVDRYWCYSDTSAPASFPADGASGWVDQNREQRNEDWSFDDSPAPRS